MSSIKLDKGLYGLLVDVFMLGARGGMSRNAGVVVDLLSAAAPPSPAFASAQAQLCFGIGDFGTAQRVLDEADRQFPDTPLVKAQLALTLAARGDAQWQAYKAELDRLPQDAATASVVRVLRHLTEGVADDGEGAAADDEPMAVPAAHLAEDAAMPMGRPI